jgi:hypothetical protein
MKKRPKLHQTTVRLDENLAQFLHMLAKEQGVSMSKLVRLSVLNNFCKQFELFQAAHRF